MRLILSRKGFDSGTGKVPSPIFEDGSMLSLPIPESDSGTTYGQIAWNGRSIGEIVDQLTRGRISPRDHAHLDPDLVRGSRPRGDGWKPSFGQCSTAQRVLENAGVGTGDLFLFFGWFRHAQERGDRLSYLRGAPDLHVLFGWLQVGEILSIPADRPPPWAVWHPHFVRPDRSYNTLYVAAEQLTIGGTQLDMPGAGVFEHYEPRLRLTASSAASRSIWEVPSWLEPRADRPVLGCHERAERWKRENGSLLLASVARGQEFVLDLDHYPEAFAWVSALLIKRSAPPG